jgi:hypothetical protein
MPDAVLFLLDGRPQTKASRSDGDGDPLRIESESHLHGEVIAEHAFPEEHDSLLGVLGGLDIPLRAAGPFTSTGRPLRPKRHTRTIGGSRKPFLLPVDQAEMNKAIDSALRSEGWTTQPIASGSFAAEAPSALKGDFVRNRVFVEVEFGNIASMFRDLFKFQIANRARTGDVGILVTATERLAKFFDSGVSTLEAARRLLPFMAIGIQMPIWVIGIEPTDFSDIGRRYEEMASLCRENGVECHDFDSAFGAKITVEEAFVPADESANDL